jgi:para-nitrobenzyl esterase
MKVLTLAIALTLAVAGPGLAQPAPSSGASDLAAQRAAGTKVQVRIETGALSGVEVGGVRNFRNIPYAAPPVGPLRWAPPAPTAAWIGARDASVDGPACMQPVGERPNGGGYAGTVSEDCLTLDVFAPAHAAHAPVMVWIYGGGNVFGADSIAPNDGRAFARDGVILVAMNYRLGALGFFAHPALTQAAKPGEPLASYGIMDQIAALKWVKRNIAAFGGDPDNVTIFGESAGGDDVLTMMSTPAARGLFQKATVQSGGGRGAPLTLAEAETAGQAIAAKAGAPQGATAEQLRALPAQAFVGLPGRYGPIVDGRLIRETPARAFAKGDQAPAELIIGSNSWEASLLPPGSQAAYVAAASTDTKAAYPEDAADPAKLAQDMFTDAVMGAPARWFAGKQSAKARAWLYEFSYVRVARVGKIPGANHTSENPYVFDTQMIVPGYATEIVDKDRAVAAFMHSCWVSFAKTGAPTCAVDGKAWPAYTPGDDALMEFTSPPAILHGYRKLQLDAQDKAAAAGATPGF